jgi:MYXO-CTERM domain-containing protein
VTVSGQQNELNACVVDRCGDCSTKTVTQGTSVVCAPTGDVPQCVCKDNVCKSPCEGRECAAGSGCVPRGPAAGECQPRTNCNFFDCRPGSYCKNSVCVNDPCANNPCAAGEVCKPSETVGEHRCVPSCATVTCQAGERCVDGACQATGCPQGCPVGQYCQQSADAGSSCAPSQCPAGPLPCSNGQYCDPATGRCGNQPCAGVKCPTGQSCTNGECYWIPEGGAGSGGSAGSAGNDAGSSGGTTGNDASAGNGGSGNAGPGNNPRGQWGLATGGGGCSCRTAPAQSFLSQAGALFAVAASVLALRRRRRRASTAACNRNEAAR